MGTSLSTAGSNPTVSESEDLLVEGTIRRHPKKKIGILAFGSLIKDPGAELLPKIAMRIKTQTPFPVEYDRDRSRSRVEPCIHACWARHRREELEDGEL